MAGGNVKWRASKALRRQLVRVGPGRRWVANRMRAERPNRRDMFADHLHPPPTQFVRAPALWVWEVYAPNHKQALDRWLTELDRSFPAPSMIAADLGERRRNESASSIMLPTLMRKGHKEFYAFNGVEGDLPEGVSCGFPWIQQLPGGIVVVLIGFVYGDGDGDELQRILGECREERITPHRNGSGRTIHHTPRVQQDAVEKFFADRAASATKWLADRAPGALATHANPLERRAGRILGFSDDTRPASERERTGWRSSLNINHRQNWHSVGSPLALSYTSNDWPQITGLSALIRKAEMYQDGERVTYESAWSSATAEVGQKAASVWLGAAFSELLSVYRAALSDLRDLEAPDGSSPREASTRLRSFQRELQLMAEARFVSAELVDIQTKHLWNTWFADDDFRNPAPGCVGLPGLRHELAVMLGLARRATEVLSLERAVRERLTLESQILATAANVRGQRGAWWIALAALGVACASLGVTFEQLGASDSGGSNSAGRAVPAPTPLPHYSLSPTVPIPAPGHRSAP